MKTSIEQSVTEEEIFEVGDLLLLKEHLVVDKQKQPQHIVLVTEFPEKGTHFSGVILTKNHHIAQGHFSNTWLKSAFVKFKGSITLSNE